MMSLTARDTYFARMSSQFRRWDAEMAMLIEEVARMDDAARARLAQQLQPMRAHRDAAYQRLQQIRTASEGSWRGLQSNVDAGWMAMQHALALVRPPGRR